MGGSGQLAQRSLKEWAIRGGGAALLAVVGYFSMTQTVAQVVVKDDPALAARIAPWDGRILAAGFESIPAASDLAERSMQARDALRRDPTAVDAVAQLGLAAQAGGDLAGARRLFGYAERLSRRNLQTQLWAIEDAVGREDIAGALRHYDVALRTKAQSRAILYPVLASAIRDAQVRAELVRTLASRPLWADDFLGYAARTGENAQATAALLAALHQRNVPVPEPVNAALIGSMVARGQGEAAWRFYAAVRGHADRRRARDPRFAAVLTAPTVFDWTPVNDGSVTGSLQPSGSNGLFDFYVVPGGGGALLKQMQVLPPGIYRLSGHSRGIEQERRALPYWVLLCGSRELGRVEVPNSAEAGGRFTGLLTVPAGCPVQTLALIARPSESVSGLVGQIDRLELAPAS